MNTNPRILLWGFKNDERSRFETFLKELGIVQYAFIEEDQGSLTVNDILFSDRKVEEKVVADQSVVLFFNMPAEVIKKVMTEIKKKDLPRPIFAMVTPENINWKFNELVDHLKKEHEFVQKKLREKKEGKH